MTFRLEKHEWILRLGLLAIYLFIRSTTFSTWEFTGDDGITLSLAQKATEQWFWLSTTSSVGVPHLPFCYYLLGIFWAIGRSLVFMQWAIAFWQVAAHWWLIGIVKRLYSVRSAYAASLLAFFSLAYFCGAGQKFWQPSLLPLLMSILLLSLMKYLRERRVGTLVTGAWIVVLAVSSLQSAIFLLPAVWAVGLLFPPKDKLGMRAWLGLALLGGLLVPLLVWIVTVHPIAVFAVAGIGTAIKYHWRQTKRRHFWAIGGALFALMITVRIFTFTADWNPVAGIANTLCAYASYPRLHLGMEATASWWNFLPESIPLALFLLVSLRGWNQQSEERKAFLVFLFLPVVAFLISPAQGTFYPHWTLFLIPWLWVGVAVGLEEAAKVFRPGAGRTAAAVALIGCLLAVQISRTLPAQKFLRISGGVGKHGPNLGQRLELFKRIAVEADPHITYMVYPYEWPTVYFYEGWNFLAHNVGLLGGVPAPTGQRKYYYIYQDTGSSWGPTLLEVARSAPGVVEAQVGPMILFVTPQPIVNAGLELRGISISDFPGASRRDARDR